MIFEDSNVLLDNVYYNDVEIDLLLRTYGTNKSILIDKNNDTDIIDSIKFNFNKE